MIHLDTGFLIRALIPGTPEEAKLRMWVGKGEAVVMSSVAWAEFLCGPLRGIDRELADRVVERRQDFTPDHAVIAARLFNESGRRRAMIIDWCAVRRRHSSAGANPARQLSLQPVAVGADDGGNDIG